MGKLNTNFTFRRDSLSTMSIKSTLFWVSSLIDGKFWVCYNKLYHTLIIFPGTHCAAKVCSVLSYGFHSIFAVSIQKNIRRKHK